MQHTTQHHPDSRGAVIVSHVPLVVSMPCTCGDRHCGWANVGLVVGSSATLETRTI